VAGVEHPPASAARSGAERHDYQPWITDRGLRELLARLEALGAAALEPTHAGTARPGTLPPKPARQPHNTVASARITCDQARHLTAFTQLRAKCDDLTSFSRSEQARRAGRTGFKIF
jgi:hypothetical protein